MGDENGSTETAMKESTGIINIAKDSDKPKNATVSVSSIQVNPRQRGNPILKEIRNVPWEFTEGIIPDYILGNGCVALFLSLRYFTLQPKYIHERLSALGSGHRLRVLLVLIDQKDPHHNINKLTRISILCNLTLMLAWNEAEAGKILETYKLFENKPPDMIMERTGTQVHEKIIEALTSVKSVSKTDAATLLGTFGTLERIIQASPEDLALCPGFGPEKAGKLVKVLRENFKRGLSQ
eukprot:TRINITY_DN71818_c0_g1_i1.p1 TRINITY_DN71818_c0_g1~~TRINITY_DN71818_c0_g1_i1.p1  ORF type:complete len:238 (+),score=22.17 TRINITY_DN71818_c0_g1_i1:79-792(+)